MHVKLGMLFAMLAVLAVQPALAQSDELVVLETSVGNITIELFDDVAPSHAENFRELAGTGFYNMTLFHRIIPGFMIQGGDPNTKDGAPATWGTGNPGHTVDAEFNNISHQRGIVSMARSADPNSAGSQFFIVHQPSTFLDNEYTVFGRIVTQQSYDILDTIAALDTETSDRPIDVQSALVSGVYTVARSDVAGLLDQGEPLRTSDSTPPIEPELIPPAELDITMGTYTNKKLNVSFEPPEGWVINEPNKVRPTIPDVIFIEPTRSIPQPTMTVDIQYVVDRSLEEYVEERLDLRSAAIDSGDFVVDTSQDSTVGDKDAMVTNANARFLHDGTSTNVKVREVVFAIDDKFYAVVYVNAVADFDTYEDEFEKLLETFTLASAESEMSMEDKEMAEEGGGCLIATAAYGTEMAQEVQLLREIRDTKLLRTASGTAFVSAFNDVYYAFSPTVADMERQSEEVRGTVRVLISPMIASLSIMSLADSEDTTLLLGSLVIALNVGIYVAIPGVAAWQIKRRLA